MRQNQSVHKKVKSGQAEEVYLCIRVHANDQGEPETSVKSSLKTLSSRTTQQEQAQCIKRTSKGTQ